jgi:hypothetical protein
MGRIGRMTGWMGGGEGRGEEGRRGQLAMGRNGLGWLIIALDEGQFVRRKVAKKRTVWG